MRESDQFNPSFLSILWTACYYYYYIAHRDQIGILFKLLLKNMREPDQNMREPDQNMREPDQNMREPDQFKLLLKYWL